jgi:diketogulonate reductase-like aldo/keto reductase
MYSNEQDVGAALQESGLDRADVFLSKVLSLPKFNDG